MNRNAACWAVEQLVGVLGTARTRIMFGPRSIAAAFGVFGRLEITNFLLFFGFLRWHVDLCCVGLVVDVQLKFIDDCIYHYSCQWCRA